MRIRTKCFSDFSVGSFNILLGIFCAGLVLAQEPVSVEDAAAIKTVPYGGGKRQVTLRNLDLSRAPGEVELRLAGQLGSALTPTYAAEPKRYRDKAKRQWQESDNMLFGKAMDKWNRHQYKEAIQIFKKHRNDFPGSAWAGETELHMGCEAQFNGRWDEAKAHFNAILTTSEIGSDIYQKAKLRLSVLLLEQGQVKGALDSFSEMLKTEDSWERTTYAQNWIRQLSLLAGNLAQLRTCGSESIAFVLETQGKRQEAEKLRASPAHGDYGFTLAELAELAKESGMTPIAVRSSGQGFASLPLPFVAHYDDEHFVVVTERLPSGALRLYDPRLKHEVEMMVDQFSSQWSGLAILLNNEKPNGVALASEDDLTRMGGCCGVPRPEDDLGTCKTQCSSCRGMPVWSVNPVNMNMTVQDIPLWHDNTVGPAVEIMLTYNSLDSLNQLRPFGNKWTFNYTSYVMEGPGGVATVVMGDGRRDVYSPNGTGGFTSPMKRADSRLTKLPTAYAYKLILSEGGSQTYGVPPSMAGSSTSSLLLSIADKNGETISFTYDANGRLTTITDALARNYIVEYNSAGYISKVNDPFGRYCTFDYDYEGNLVAQTDMGGIAYSYSYTKKNVEMPNSHVIEANNLFIDSITTPNGTTSFYTEPADGINNGFIAYPKPNAAMWSSYRITVTGPDGDQQEYHFDGYSKYSWHRDGRQYAALLTLLAGATTTSAYNTTGIDAPKTRYDFTIQGGKGFVTTTKYANNEEEKESSLTSNAQPIYVYDAKGGQSYYTYNSQGQILTHRNPRNFTTTYTYESNGLDVKTIKNAANIVTAQYTYDSARRVISLVDALNKTTGYTYTARGNSATTTNALGQVTTYVRNALEQITSIQQAGQIIQSFTYDAVGRIATTTDAAGVTLAYEYDNLNRRIKIIHGDGSFEQSVYSCCNLDSHTDREGRTTHYAYDGNKRMTSMTDPAGRTTQYFYDAAGNLVKLIDGNGSATEWEYDARNRMIKKIYADGESETYTRDGNGNITQKINAREQTITYDFDANNNLISMSAPGVTATTYVYDNRDRVTSMTQGTSTTTFSYDNANRRTGEDGPLANDAITYTFDALGRPATVGGVLSRSFVYDVLGRPASESNGLGAFSYGYLANSSRMTSTSLPFSRSISYTYGSPQFERRLVQTKILQNGSLVTQYDYAYDANGQITGINESGGAALIEASYGYNDADELTGATFTEGSTDKSFSYNYDNAGNRVQENGNGASSTGTFNNLNQQLAQSAQLAAPVTSTLRVKGLLNEPGTVKVNGVTQTLQPGSRFDTEISAVSGANAFSIQATDAQGNSRTNSYSATVSPGPGRSFTYDFDGNLLGNGSANYTWDSLNRLTRIDYANGTASEFTYDGMSRRTKIVELAAGGAVTSTRQFVWDGTQIVGQLDGNGNVVRRYYPQGFVDAVLSLPYLYDRDHLGSIRKVVGSDGVTQSSYRYGPWGERSYAALDPAPKSGAKTHRSEIRSGAHQHYFTNATAKLPVGAGDKLVCWVYLDPKAPPREILLQWTADGSLWHQAYWGENLINWGAAVFAGALPATGGWTRLEVSAALIGAEGKQLNGMAFGIHGGRAWWDAAGKRLNGASSDTLWVDDDLPAGATPVVTDDTWTWAKAPVEADMGYTGHWWHEPSKLWIAPYRQYDPSVGRWLSRDPLENITGKMAETLPEGPNLYSYVGNEPVNFIDKLGLLGGPSKGNCCQKFEPTWKHEGYSSAVACANDKIDLQKHAPDVPSPIMDSLEIPLKYTGIAWLTAYGYCTTSRCVK